MCTVTTIDVGILCCCVPVFYVQTTCVAFTPGTKHNDLWKGCAGKIKNSISW